MDLHRIRVFHGREVSACIDHNQRNTERKRAGERLRALAAVMLTLASCIPPGFAQQTVPPSKEKNASSLPPAPAPILTQPFNLRQTGRDFSKPPGGFFGLGDPILWWRPTTLPKASFANSLRLDKLLKDGKIYLSLSDAIALAIENNYDIAIARYDLEIADTDILRTDSGGLPLGAPSGLVTGTLGGSASTLTTGGGPGGTTVGSGGAGSGVSGLTLTTAGAGPAPALLDPAVTANIQFERARVPQANTLFSFGKNTLTTNTNTYNVGYTQGFITGASLNVALSNQRITTDNPLQVYSPLLTSTFRATLTQHLLQGAGIWINKRFIYQAMNDRRITDSSFRQQILYTVNQVETIYWGLVQAYEDVQAKESALAQSTKLLADNKKQLQIGTMAPLDVINAESSVATDKQALISAQSALNYQQQIIKQAIARNLNDPVLEKAPVIPTDRVSLKEIPEETEPIDSLVKTAFKKRPELEQAMLTLRNDEITLKGARNAMLPTLDIFGFYGSAALGGAQSPNAIDFRTGQSYTPGTYPGRSYGGVFQNLFNSSAPDKGMGFNLTVPLRNRQAQATQQRSLMEYRQAELRLAQLYTQIRMQVVNAKYALTNDRAQVQAALAARNYSQQSLGDEEKKLRLGASTTANVMLQERNLAAAEDNLIAAHAAFAKDRASLYQTLGTTLQQYGINLPDAASGDVNSSPLISGVQSAKPGNEPSMTPPHAE